MYSPSSSPHGTLKISSQGSAAGEQQLQGSLYIVATPIGNLTDITQRAITVLSEVDYIAAEDTRHSARLLQHLNINKSLYAYHDHSDQKQVTKLCGDLVAGQSIALISDAGTPLISDPGYALVKAARQQGIPVIPIPGPCALIAGLSIAGLPTDRFTFEGFLPAKQQARQSRLHVLSAEARTMVFYESTHRIVDSLTDMANIFGAERIMTITRELTKSYETVLSGEIAELIECLQHDNQQQRGEFVLIVSGVQKQTPTTIDCAAAETMQILLGELPTKQAAAIGAKLTGIKKRDLYQWAVEQKGE